MLKIIVRKEKESEIVCLSSLGVTACSILFNFSCFLLKKSICWKVSDAIICADVSHIPKARNVLV